MESLRLIHGQFSKTDAVNLVSQLIEVKIRFHEDKIRLSENEEDIKMRERKIRQLQDELAAFRKQAQDSPETISLHAMVELEA